MLRYRFKPNRRTDRRVALTADPTGSVPPKDGAPWQSIGQLDLDENTPWIKVPKADVESAIAKKGYFIGSVSIAPIKWPRRRAYSDQNLAS